MSTDSLPASFVWEVLSGRSSPELPSDPAPRKKVVDLLRMHRLLGVWYVESGFARRCVGDSPSELSNELRGLHVQRALHTELTLESADRARQALAAAGFPSLLFKGAALVRGGVYTDPGARILGDADLLIQEREVGRAIRTLESVGFRPWVPWEESRLGWLAAFTLADGEAPEGLEITLDLHWRIPYGSYRSQKRGSPRTGRSGATDEIPPRLWKDADLERGLPTREAHFLLIAEHFVRHLRVTPHVIGIADLVRLAAGDLNPELLVHEARTYGGMRSLRALLAFLHSDLKVPLAPQLLDAVGVPQAVTGLKARALAPERLLAPPGNRKEGRVAGLVVESLAFGSFGTFLGEMRDVLHPSADWLEHRYGSLYGTGLRRRIAHWNAVGRWLLGRGVSPLSPNQEFEDPRR